ncbi:hypothetical protein M427DRAFT_235116 [Gonapodya prolifera JEL478]|uniref:Uncharacterized protein n=1 Tax=Gonapodya prolifera (strain JEL478) TaxID=1344416 RepID=A0A139AMA0_GONPJ|nr:hypothetical protein M427DRAFT_235116 [Gonapodya prolifera JEL478]|eukprot:KXS17906.1 hypothetical protein M427DRAFT_235116 [Gonapodya prolifera JEL478]
MEASHTVPNALARNVVERMEKDWSCDRVDSGVSLHPAGRPTDREIPCIGTAGTRHTSPPVNGECSSEMNSDSDSGSEDELTDRASKRRRADAPTAADTLSGAPAVATAKDTAVTQSQPPQNRGRGRGRGLGRARVDMLRGVRELTALNYLRGSNIEY